MKPSQDPSSRSPNPHGPSSSHEAVQPSTAPDASGPGNSPQPTQAADTSSQRAPSGANETADETEDIAQSLTALEKRVAAVRQRHSDVIQAQAEKQELRVRLNRAQRELQQHRTQQIQAEVKALQARLEEVELILESQLFSWSGLKEPFWQAIRFGGIGVVIGWVLKTLS